MLVLATEIPVRADRVVTELFEVGRRWILGSPHTRFSGETFPCFPGEGEEVEASAGGDMVTLALGRDTQSPETIGGLRYVQAEYEGLVWSTELVGAHDGQRFLVSVRVDCEARAAVPRLPDPKKPYIVRLVLEQLGGGADGDLDVSHMPLLLEPADMDLAVRAMRGGLGNSLPVVYVSAANRSTHLVSPSHAAREWGGLAHVFVEPDRAFSFRLRQEVTGKNAYGGAIGIYLPDGAGRRFLLPSERLGSPELAEREVFNDLRIALTHRRPSRICTWSHLQQLIARARYERVKQEGSEDLAEYAALADADIKELKAELQESEDENRRLQSENRRLNALVSDDDAGGVLAGGSEQDLFSGERLGVVLDALRDRRTRLDEDSRPAHVIDDFIANNEHEHVSEGLRRDIQDLLKDYRSMTPRVRGQLEDLGFEVSDDGKHLKLTFLGDPRYTFVASKTGSEYRGGRNLVSQINRKLFSRE